ncbi:MAG: hypothetical protein Q8K32_29830 [Archangium sp.]|nr:hypothetical protein [Archangium sp.]
MSLPLIVLLSVVGAELTHAELKLTIDLPEGWKADACGPFVPPLAECRVDGKLSPCPATICPERVGVLWLTSPVSLESKEDVKAELLANDAGAVFVNSSTLADGWVLAWGGAAWADTYPFKVSRKIGARVIECFGEATTLAGQKHLIDACKSVRGVKKP